MAAYGWAGEAPNNATTRPGLSACINAPSSEDRK